MWYIWLARNHFLFRGVRPDQRQIVQQAIDSTQDWVGTRQSQPARKHDTTYIPEGSVIILVDASWDPSQNTGLANVIYDNRGKLLQITSLKTTTDSPFTAEVHAILMAIKNWVSVLPAQQCLIFTDCKKILDIFNNATIKLPTWTSEEVFHELQNLLTRYGYLITLKYIPRELVKPAHDLATWCRSNPSTNLPPPEAPLQIERCMSIQWIHQ